MASHFLIFIGGTGAKCAEAFVHMAASGVMGGRGNTFHVLTMDVDATNGNRGQALEAVGRYALLRETFPATAQYAESPLFGPEIIHYDWHVTLPDSFPQAAGKNCLSAMRTQGENDEEALMRLFYTDEELGFDFSREGFHAIPAIGAPVIQYILDSGESLGRFAEFCSAFRLEVRDDSHIVVCGSIFGGTGACGIPAVTRYMNNIMRTTDLRGRCESHGVLMLPYYRFGEPGAKDEMGVHARKFYNNTRGALAFYDGMEAELAYSSVYLIGSPVDYDMGGYCPGMENQKNPPTPMEWESALAIAHSLAAPLAGGGRTVQFITCAQGETENQVVQRLRVGWDTMPFGIQDEIGNMTRFAAAYLGYYHPYLHRHENKKPEGKPFFQELIRPYLEEEEDDDKGFAALEAFLKRYWQWLKQSLGYEIVDQACFTDRMMRSDRGYPAKHLQSLVQGKASTGWWTVEGQMFAGILPISDEGSDLARRNAGLFVHGLYDQCML